MGRCCSGMRTCSRGAGTSCWRSAPFARTAKTRDCTITYRYRGKKLATAVVHRDLEGLRAELEFERTIAATQR